MDTVDDRAAAYRAAQRSSLLALGLSAFGHLLRRWAQQPIGVVAPLFAWLVLLLAPQSPDMLAGISDRVTGAPLPWGGAIAYGFAAAFLGLVAWYWTRAGLQGARGQTDLAWRSVRRPVVGGVPMNVQAAEWQDWNRKRSREWAPRVALVIAGGIAVVPVGAAGATAVWGTGLNLLVALATVTAAAVGFHQYRRRLRDRAPWAALLLGLANAFVPMLAASAGGAAADDCGPLVAGATGLALVFWVFVFVTDRVRGRAAAPVATAAGPRWYWAPRVTAVIAAAPFGGGWAIALLLLSVAGVWVVAARPHWVEQTTPAPVAALAALALSIGPLVIALALLRDLAHGILSLLGWTWERAARAFAAIAGGGVPVRPHPAWTAGRHQGELRRVSGALGFAALLYLVLAGPVLIGPGPHGLRLQRAETAAALADRKASVRNRPDIDTAVARWRAAKLALGHPAEQPLPLIIVTAEGGASRAATWLLSAMRLLDAETGGTAEESGAFARYLFAISGVSGGSLGAVTYAQALRAYGRADGGIDWHGDRVEGGLRRLGAGDLLAATIATYFLNDTLGRLSLGLWAAVPDRAVALERAFERHWRDPAGWGVAAAEAEGSFLSLRRGAAEEPPHLLINGTDVTTGRRLITSTIRFDPQDDLFAGSDDLLAMLRRDIPAATAVTNSARFPYISPAGRFRSNGTDRQIIDGGYFENYGLRTATELARKVAEIGRREGWALVPMIVVVSNDGDGCRFGTPEQCWTDANGNPVAVTTEAAATGSAVCLIAKNGKAVAVDGHPPSACAGIRPLPAMTEVAFHCGQRPVLLPPETAEDRDGRVEGAVPEVLAPFLGLYATRSAHGEDAKHIARRLLCREAEPALDAARQALFGDGGNQLFHIALPKPIPAAGEAAPLNWVLNQRTARFLIDVAPQVAFNRDQAARLDGALAGLLGGEGKGRQTARGGD